MNKPGSPGETPSKKTTCFFLFLRVSASQGHCSPKGRNGSRIFEPFVKLQCFFLQTFEWAPQHSYKESSCFRNGGGQMFPFLSTVLERASRGMPRECKGMCWLLGAASLNSFMSARKRAALDSPSLHGRNGATGTQCPILLMQPVEFSLAPSLLAPFIFFRKIFDFGCKQSPRKASAPQENR